MLCLKCRGLKHSGPPFDSLSARFLNYFKQITNYFCYVGLLYISLFTIVCNSTLWNLWRIDRWYDTTTTYNHQNQSRRENASFNVHGSVHRKNIPIYIQQDATLHSLFYLETAVHVSGGTSTHHQERIQLYLQYLIFVTSLLLPAALAAGSSNNVTNTRWCRYSCMHSWWWVEVPPETCTAVSR